MCMCESCVPGLEAALNLEHVEDVPTSRVRRKRQPRESNPGRDVARAYKEMQRNKRLIESAGGQGTPRKGGMYG